MKELLPFLLIYSTCVWDAVLGCKLLRAPKYYSMQYTLYHADVVVIGTDVLHVPPPVPPPRGFTEGDENYAIFTVDCVLKSGQGNTIGQNITLLEGAMRHNCRGTHLEIGSRYILALDIADIANQTYNIYEPNTLNPGGFTPTEENLNVAITVCGLDERRALDGAPDGACPAMRAATAEECVKGTGSDFDIFGTDPPGAAVKSAALSTLVILCGLALDTLLL